MEAKHTLGPWRWREYGGRIELVAPHSGTLLVMDFTRKGWSGAQPRFAIRSDSMGGIMRDASDMDFENHPDARLIAAAPDLLEACKELCRRLEANELVNRPSNPCNHYDQPAYDRARAAIAKATGGGGA
jgi:hypothetical protein